MRKTNTLALATALAALTAGLASANSPSAPQERDTSKVAARVAFNIPAQPLGTSLKQVADQAGIQILFEERVVSGIEAPSIKANQSAIETLHALLKDTDLEFTSKDQTIAVRKRSKTTSVAPAAGPLRLAQAETTDAPSGEKLEEVVLDEVILIANRATSVGKLDAPLKSLPQNITVVTSETLEHFGKPRLEDLAYATIGLQAVAPSAGAYSNGFFIRGFNGAPVITDGYYATATQFGTSGIQEMALYDSVEVLRGPASLLYGQGNPGGVINLTTKRPLRQPGVQFDAYGDQHGGRRIEGDATGPVASFAEARLVTVYDDSETFRDFVEQQRVLVSPTLYAHLGESVDVKLNYTYDDFEFTPDNGLSINEDLFRDLPIERNLSEPWMPLTRSITHTSRIEADWHLADAWTLRGGYFRTTGRTVDGQTEIDPDATIGGTVTGRWFGRSRPTPASVAEMLTLQMLGKFSTGSLAHTVTVAGDYVSNASSFNYDWYIFPSIDYANPQYLSGMPDDSELIPLFAGEFALKLYVRAAYAQDLVSIGDRWKVLLGVRRDEIVVTSYADQAATLATQRLEDAATTPRLGLVYQLNDATTLYASYSEAFVPQSGLTRDGVPHKPEESLAYEIGLRRQFGRGMMLTASVYDIEKKNILVVDPASFEDEFESNINAGVAESRGVEMELAGSLTNEWRITSGIAYTDAKITESVDPNYFPVGDALPSATRWSALLGSTYDIAIGADNVLSLGGNIAYASKRDYMVPNQAFELGAYTRLDLFGTLAINRKIDVQLTVTNVTDERILLGNGYGRVQFDLPRTWSVNLRYGFGSLN